MRRLRALTIAGAVLAALAAAGPAATAQTATDPPPTKPGNLRVLSATDVNIQLGWDKSTDDSGIVMFFLLVDDLPPNLIGTNITTYDVEFNRATGWIPGSTHTFQVLAQDPSGNDVFSNEITASFLPGDNTPPTAPGDLRVAGTSPDGVELAWNPSIDEAEFEYLVHNQSSVCNPIVVSGDTTQVLVPSVNLDGWCGITPGQTYTFNVQAIDELHNVSAHSNTVSVFFP